MSRDLTGNLPGLPAVFPDMMAPVVRAARDGERELSLMAGAPGRRPTSARRKVSGPAKRVTPWDCAPASNKFAAGAPILAAHEDLRRQKRGRNLFRQNIVLVKGGCVA
jgi:hypothetical protein